MKKEFNYVKVSSTSEDCLDLAREYATLWKYLGNVFGDLNGIEDKALELEQMTKDSL